MACMSAIPQAAFDELQALYGRMSAALEPFRRHCTGRGICCNFAKAGHMLYVSDLEAAEMARSGGTPDMAQARDGSCPYLKEKLCSIRDHRAIGCRLYYCDKTYETERNALYESYMKEVRAIEVRYGVAYSYRPVTQIDFEALKPA
ncbi:MAG TPA: hypothetical protein VEK08_06370 [Planctomycetota bacterium]|nr:hypothetical protein [Planctomycetota bacterium]